MKLLLIDKRDLSTITRAEILKLQYHYDVDVVHTFEDVRSEFIPGKFHTVILDFTTAAGAKALEYIDATDPNQRVIVISNCGAYNEPRGCAYCVKHYNRRYLKEPVGIMDLDNLIRDFDETSCAYYHD